MADPPPVYPRVSSQPAPDESQSSSKNLHQLGSNSATIFPPPPQHQQEMISNAPHYQNFASNQYLTEEAAAPWSAQLQQLFPDIPSFEAPTIYKGVRQRRNGKWGAEVSLPLSSKRCWLGTYDMAKDAALAYDHAAFKLRGSEARLNFPHLFICNDREAAVEFSEASKLVTSFESEQLDTFPIKFKSVQYGQMEHQYTEDLQVQSVSYATETEQSSPAASEFKKTRIRKRKMALHLTLEDLTPHFGKKLKDVAKELGVGRSTIKRTCRDHGINRWPCKEEQARNPSLFGRESARHPQQDMPPSSSSSLQLQDTSLHQNMTCIDKESTQHVVVQEEAEKVVIRVKYEEDTIKFELCLPLGVSKLFEEVVRRLNLKMGSFKLKYLDEDDEEILIACDEDLQLCPKIQTATGKNYIQLFVPR